MTQHTLPSLQTLVLYNTIQGNQYSYVIQVSLQCYRATVVSTYACTHGQCSDISTHQYFIQFQDESLEYELLDVAPMQISSNRTSECSDIAPTLSTAKAYLNAYAIAPMEHGASNAHRHTYRLCTLRVQPSCCLYVSPVIHSTLYVLWLLQSIYVSSCQQSYALHTHTIGMHSTTITSKHNSHAVYVSPVIYSTPDVLEVVQSLHTSILIEHMVWYSQH